MGRSRWRTATQSMVVMVVRGGTHLEACSVRSWLGRNLVQDDLVGNVGVSSGLWDLDGIAALRQCSARQ